MSDLMSGVAAIEGVFVFCAVLNLNRLGLFRVRFYKVVLDCGKVKGELYWALLQIRYTQSFF